MSFIFNDGGRAAAGFKGQTGDCVVRATAIATGKSYKEVYLALRRLMKGIGTPRKGVPRPVYDKYLRSLGWKWTPTMKIGSGCAVHLRGNQLPAGRLIARLSKHMAAVVDGVVHDTYDCSRGGTRCVYGYYHK